MHLSQQNCYSITLYDYALLFLKAQARIELCQLIYAAMKGEQDILLSTVYIVFLKGKACCTFL